MSEAQLAALIAEIEACRHCPLPHEPRPVVWVQADARILIVGQAPGRRVHESGIPWNDSSGDRLRAWMGLSREEFYDKANIAVVGMAFCYPGTVNGADLPPRAECAPRWRARLLPLLPNVRLTLLVGSYALAHYGRRGPMADAVRDWRSFGQSTLPLPHPSWRNTGWLKRNPWFDAELLPVLRDRTAAALSKNLTDLR